MLVARKQREQSLDLFAGSNPASDEGMDLLAGSQTPQPSPTQSISPTNTAQRLIQQSRSGSAAKTPLGLVPQNLEEAKDAGRVALRQFVPNSPGVVGLGARLIDDRKISLPEPKTGYGDYLEKSADTAGLAMGVKGLMSAFKKAPNYTKALAKATKEQRRAKGVADELYSGSRGAIKNVGRDYESIVIGKYGDTEVPTDQVSEALEKAPKALIEEIKNNPYIEKTVDAMGRTVIKPTIKNLKYLRDVVRGDVPAKHWKPKMVDDATNKAATYIYDLIGDAMRTGNDEIADVMGRYRNVRNAADEVYTTLRTPKGMTKTNPVSNIYKPGAEGSKQQAFEALAMENPELYKSLNNAKSFGEAQRRAHALKKFGGAVGRWAGYGAAGGLAWDRFNS